MIRIQEAGTYEFRDDRGVGSDEHDRPVRHILGRVRQEGDAAVRKFTKEFDGVSLDADQLRVTDDEVQDAYNHVDEEFLAALRSARDNIRSFHEKQVRKSWSDRQKNGTMVGELVRPLRRVGVYVPGGTAAYASSVLMNVIPAQVAGVAAIAMVTPPSTGKRPTNHPEILVAACEVGVREIYRVGGAQAIAALAFGTETIAPVDKICGPGNIFVALAKRQVFGVVDIDSIAGPTDIAILADASANPAYIAADLLSQAEHDEMAKAILVTDSEPLARSVRGELEKQVASLPRRDIAAASLKQNGALLTVSTMEEGIDVINRLAPEHLELLVEAPMELLDRVANAGAIFLGPYSSESVGDYFAGPNHILPTNGTARFSSPLSVSDFQKSSNVIEYSREALRENAEAIMTLARSEGLEGHARAIQIRLEESL